MSEQIVSQQSFLNKSRKDKFLLVLGLPKALLKAFPDITIREMQISVFGSPVPSIQIPSIDVPFSGQTLKVTSQTRASYGPLSVSFTVDNEFKNYWTLWKWMDLINDSINSGMNNYFGKYSEVSNKIVNKDLGQSVYFDYMTDLTIYGLDEYNNKKIKFLYKNAFITDLSQIDYNYRTSDELECSVSFAFSQLQSELIKEC